MAHQPTFGQLVAVGWFPFLELMSGEFEKLISMCQSGFELDDDEKALVEKLDETRLGSDVRSLDAATPSEKPSVHSSLSGQQFQRA